MLKLPNIWTWKGSAAASLYRLPLLSPCCALAGHKLTLGPDTPALQAGAGGGGGAGCSKAPPSKILFARQLKTYPKKECLQTRVKR